MIFTYGLVRFISQDDLAEKSAQLLLMREVYHAAAFVQIWLGSSNAEGKRCLEFISDLTRYYYGYSTLDEDCEERILNAMLVPAAAILNVGQKFAQAIFEAVDIVEPNAREDKAALILDSDRDHKRVNHFTAWQPSNRRLKKVENENFAEIAGLIDLIFSQRCSWFERMWVVQELGIAYTPGIVYDGMSISWDDFSVLHITSTIRANFRYLISRNRQGWRKSAWAGLTQNAYHCTT